MVVEVSGRRRGLLYATSRVASLKDEKLPKAEPNIVQHRASKSGSFVAVKRRSTLRKSRSRLSFKAEAPKAANDHGNQLAQGAALEVQKRKSVLHSKGNESKTINASESLPDVSFRQSYRKNLDIDLTRAQQKPGSGKQQTTLLVAPDELARKRLRRASKSQAVRNKQSIQLKLPAFESANSLNGSQKYSSRKKSTGRKTHNSKTDKDNTGSFMYARSRSKKNLDIAAEKPERLRKLKSDQRSVRQIQFPENFNEHIQQGGVGPSIYSSRGGRRRSNYSSFSSSTTSPRKSTTRSLHHAPLSSNLSSCSDQSDSTAGTGPYKMPPVARAIYVRSDKDAKFLAKSQQLRSKPKHFLPTNLFGKTRRHRFF